MFELPDSTIVNRVIPKNAFDMYSNARQKKQFTEKVAKLRWQNKLSPQTVNLSGKDMTELQIFIITLKVKDTVEEVLKVIDRSIPYPIIFILEYENEEMISLSQKHIHPVNEDLAIIDWTFCSDWFPANKIPYRINLKQSLDYVFNDLCFQLSGKIHTTDMNISDLILQEQKIKQLKHRITQLQSEIKRCRQFNKKVELNIELQACQYELNLIEN
jgi:hypothetical protein